MMKEYYKINDNGGIFIMIRKTNSLGLLLRCVVETPEGKILFDSGSVLSKSFVIQFTEWLWWLFHDGSSINDGKITDTSGAETWVYWSPTHMIDGCRVDAPINNSDYGIVVGTGDTGETNIDNKLETQLTEGIGGGDITHNVCNLDVLPQVVGANVDFVFKRSFTNNTGALITVKETGVYVKNMGDIPVADFYHCFVRDVLPAPVNVPDMCSITVYYTFRTTV